MVVDTILLTLHGLIDKQTIIHHSIFSVVTIAVNYSCAFSFNTACMMTTIGCGLMFYTGLRLGRSIYRPILPVVPGPDYLNLRMDAQLSMAVGGATGCFVGTDVSYGSSNWLGVFGIGVEETDSVLEGMIKAGTLTAMGFTAVQTAQNVFVPHNHCWLD